MRQLQPDQTLITGSGTHWYHRLANGKPVICLSKYRQCQSVQDSVYRQTTSPDAPSNFGAPF